MTDRRVLVIGSSGMLGGAIYRHLNANDVETLGASRSHGIIYDAEMESPETLLETADLRAGDYALNCIGLTKAHIRESDPESVERATRLNVLFPLALARAAEQLNVRVVQVATDCVFSGRRGEYSESSPHDAFDVYGKSKSMGEVKSKNVMHLRCSLVGPETQGRKSLFFEWVRASAPKAILKGYVNHHWNGLTSLAFARIATGLIKRDEFIAGLHHLVPADAVTKFELIKIELELLGRNDVLVEEYKTELPIDRTLVTDDPATNKLLFAFGGYTGTPTVREMMEELPWGALRES